MGKRAGKFKIKWTELQRRHFQRLLLELSSYEPQGGRRRLGLSSDAPAQPLPQEHGCCQCREGWIGVLKNGGRGERQHSDRLKETEQGQASAQSSQQQQASSLSPGRDVGQFQSHRGEHHADQGATQHHFRHGQPSPQLLHADGHHVPAAEILLGRHPPQRCSAPHGGGARQWSRHHANEQTNERAKEQAKEQANASATGQAKGGANEQANEQAKEQAKQDAKHAKIQAKQDAKADKLN